MVDVAVGGITRDKIFQSKNSRGLSAESARVSARSRAPENGQNSWQTESLSTSTAHFFPQLYQNTYSRLNKEQKIFLSGFFDTQRNSIAIIPTMKNIRAT